jgi:hypothetical protein
MKDFVYTRKRILQDIAQELNAVKSLKKSNNFASCIKAEAVAEHLICKLEAADCGSIGGYDPLDPMSYRHVTHETRFQWLKSKDNPQNKSDE